MGQPVHKSKTYVVVLALLATVAFRLPELLNPGVVNSDSAIVGLQAMHLLRGEWHWFLWGSGYQTTADAVVAALLFMVMGATPLALICTALCGHLLAVLFALLTISRRLPLGVAWLLVAPLIFASAPTQTYTLHPPRQTALTLIFAAIWVLDGAAQARRRWLQFGVGSALATFACFADPYALLLLPGVALLAWLALFDGDAARKVQFQRGLAAAVGAALGGIPFVIVRSQPGAEGGPLTLTRELLRHNWELFKGPCLQWVLGTRVLHQPANAVRYLVWQPPVLIHIIQWLGAAVFAVGLCSAVALVASRQVPWELRRLAVMGVATVILTVLGFLLSVMPMDHYSSRYLVALVLVTPFFFAPMACRLRPWVTMAVMTPLLVSFGLCGWLGYEPCVAGVRIVDTHWSENEEQLEQELVRRGIAVATADYWAAYRLTFMLREKVKVVPIHEHQDRYLPYRQAFEHASRYAYIYDHRRSDESLQSAQANAARGRTEHFSVGYFDVFIVERATNPSRT